MSQLSPFIRALRAEAEALAYVANERGDDSYFLTRLSEAKSRAATDLEQQIAKDLSRVGPRSDEAVNLDRVPSDSAWQPPEEGE